MKIKMKKTTILFLIIILSLPIVVSYRYSNESGYNLDVDFANGGVQEKSNDYNTSSIIGESLTPFNDTTSTYNINQGLYYIIWSDIILALPLGLLTFSFNIQDFGIEWVKLNWTN